MLTPQLASQVGAPASAWPGSTSFLVQAQSSLSTAQGPAKGVTWVPKVGGGRKFEAEICDVIHGVIYIKFFCSTTVYAESANLAKDKLHFCLINVENRIDSKYSKPRPKKVGGASALSSP